jgi:RNA polymerase primary sigma factor
VHVPAGVQNLTKKALALFSEYGDMGRVAKELDIDVDKAYSLVGNPNSCSSLNEIIGDADGSVEKIDLLADNTSETNDKESAQKVQKMLTILDKREEMVVRLRFGLGVGKEYTLEEVGQVIGVTRERARQIEKKAVGKLKKAEMA